MRFTHYADALFESCDVGVMLACEEGGKYDSAARRARDIATDALRAENAKLAAERDDREQTKEREREKTHGPRVRFDLLDGLHPRQVDEAIARGRRAGDIGHRTVAFYLADCADRGLFQDLGHASAISYAVKRHRISRRSARSLIVAGRALRELLKVDQAFVENRLSWSMVRAIARVADPKTEVEWLGFALTHTIEEVEKAAALAKKGEKPREDRRGLPEIRFDVRLRVSALIHEQYLLARQRLGAEAGRDVTDEEFAGAILESFLRKPGEGTESSDSLYRVVLDLRPAEGKATIRSEDGPVDVDPAMAEAICCDAGVVSEDGKAHGHHAPPISDSLRRRILARDGHKCRVCGSRFQLHVHHIVWRSEHGSNAWSNLTAACTRCHALVHGGFLTITGRAPDGLELRDRKGDLITEPARFVENGDRTALEITAAPALPDSPASPEGGGPGGPPDSGFSAAKPEVATLPAGPIDRDWLLRHQHLLSLEASNAALRLKRGTPRDQVSVVREDEGAYSTSGDGTRPTTLELVVGQPGAVARLRTFAQASRNSGQMPPPALLLGDSGLAIEDGLAPLRFTDGIAIKTVSFVLPSVSWIAATTNPERMAHAFRGRFRTIYEPALVNSRATVPTPRGMMLGRTDFETIERRLP